MSNDLNQCNFIGRLGKDPEVRYAPSGKAVCSFNIACGWKGKDTEGTEWVRIVAYDKLAEICGEYLKKGSQIFVCGRFKTDKYEKDGQTHYSTQIVADRMQMLGSRQDAEAPAPAPAARRPATHGDRPGGPKNRPAPSTGFDDMDDSIPF